MSSAPGPAVFLSYASQDAEAAQRICDALRAADVEVWFDQNELVGGEGAAELFAVHRVLARGVPAEFSRTHCAPGDAVTRAIETAEGAGKTFYIRQQVCFGDQAIV